MIPLTEKYRPNDIDDVLFHPELIDALKNFKDPEELPNLIFYGNPGIGKTSCAIAFARKIYGSMKFEK